MKRIMAGKKYDTETAVEVGQRGCEHGEEVLFRKKSGEYFLHVTGGVCTRDVVSAGQSFCVYDEKIIPLSYSTAKAWAESALDSDEYEAAFGEVVDDDTLVPLNTTLSATANDKLRKMSSAAGMSLKAMLEKLILEA